MKMILGAIALTLAVPAFAQAAPATDPHAGHQMPAKEGEHDCKKCCEKMKQQGGNMECMDKKGEAQTSSSAQQDHQGHDGHAH